MLSSRTALVALMALAALVVGTGCGQSAHHETEGRVCRTDSECGAEERCETEAEPPRHPLIYIPCSYTQCGAMGECADGFVCLPSSSAPMPSFSPYCGPNVCVPRCTSTSCPQGQVCRDTGVCAVPQCNEAGVEACPAHWRCDPAAAKAEPIRDYGSVLEDSLADEQSIVRGCVRKRCDEADGHTCQEFWSCAPEATTGGAGCVPKSCRETGHCENEQYICEPTSSKSRPAGEDFYGCVFRNCEEGLECLAPTGSDPSVAYCDFSAPNANSSGCALRTCAEGNRCVDTYVCDPSSPQANSIGCVPGPNSGGSGGSVGNGGSSSTGGSSAGGSVSAGGSGGSGSNGGLPPGEGHCVRD